MSFPDDDDVYDPSVIRIQSQQRRRARAGTMTSEAHRRPPSRSRARAVLLSLLPILSTPRAVEALMSTMPRAPPPPPTRERLEAMTVRELKVHVKEAGMVIPRGEASKLLRLKGDIVDFILDRSGRSSSTTPAMSVADRTQLNDSDEEGGGEGEVAEIISGRGGSDNKKLRKRTSGTGMPPLPSSVVSFPEPDDADGGGGGGDESPSRKFISPLSRLVRDVLDRYPALREAVEVGCAANGVDDVHQVELSSLQYAIPSGIGEKDVRHRHHPALAGLSSTDMDVVFVGTASCSPGVTRGVSCTALRLNWRATAGPATESVNQRKEERSQMAGTWVFDCGESTQLSVQRTSSVKPGKISKIFITHCHGDHSFGLPGLLCLMGTDRDRDAPPVDIYGPEGLRTWLRVAVRYSVSRIVPPYRVHELMDVPMAPEWEEGRWKNGRYYYQLSKAGGKNGAAPWGANGLAGDDPNSWISRAPMMNLEPSKDFGEIDGGRDIYPRYDHPLCSDGAPMWEVENEGDLSVYAAPMSHGVPCVGYVVQEEDQPGRLRPDLVEPIIRQNYDELIKAGMKNPMKMMAVIKNLPVGESHTFPDGTTVRQEDVVESTRKGRKVVICGDTTDCRAIEGLAQGADVLIHEATNAFLPGIDKSTSLKLVSKDAKLHGHSTPQMAGVFAKKIGAKKLVMNHFSARYMGDQSIESMTIMTRIERSAMESSGLPDNAVACAWDFMMLPVPRN